MTYIRVEWRQDDPEFPVLLYSELDDHRYEVRKVEIFKSDKWGYASSKRRTKGTRLGTIPVPSLREIAAEREFKSKHIKAPEFETVWKEALRKRSR